ncbi:MAG TPA: hypothetical protein VNO30_46515 [Kofleriaceae bacterium]|nr:hypothetical protein [Kofleriaceae bacterium]
MRTRALTAFTKAKIAPRAERAITAAGIEAVDASELERVVVIEHDRKAPAIIRTVHGVGYRYDG